MIKVISIFLSVVLALFCLTGSLVIVGPFINHAVSEVGCKADQYQKWVEDKLND